MLNGPFFALAFALALVILALLTAVYSAMTNRLRSKITSYRLQTLALSMLAAIEIRTNPWFVGIAFILVIQIVVIARLMAYVTNDEGRQPGQSWFDVKWERMNVAKAQSVWVEYDPEHDPKTNRVGLNSQTSLIGSITLIVVAYVVAFSIAPDLIGKFRNTPIIPPSQLTGNSLVYSLGASLGLLLVGQFNMIKTLDIRSQIMGLLVMENGLFLAAVIIIEVNEQLVPAFLFTMIAWYALTWVILINFLPRVKEFSGSIYVGDQDTLKE